MRRIDLAATAIALVLSTHAVSAQKPGVEKLYILNCGEGVTGDVSRWSPGVNEGKSMDFVDNCYLIKHSQGWLLWDTGVPDAVASMPNGLAPAEDARGAAGADRRQARRHQGARHLAHPRRPRR